MILRPLPLLIYKSDNVANIVVWSIVESGIGIMAGSLPSLRKLVSSRFHFDSSSNNSPAQITPFSGTNRAIITSNSAPAPRKPNKAGASALGEGEGEWEQLDDAASSQKIYVKVDLEMQSLERPATSRASHGSSDDLVR